MAKLNYICSKYFLINIKKIVFFMFVTSVYTGYNIGKAKLSEAGILEFMTEMITDFYLIVFVIFPLFGLCLFSTLFSHGSEELIRHKSFRAYFFTGMIPISIFSFLFVLIPSIFSFAYALILRFPSSIQPTGYLDDVAAVRLFSNSEYSVLFAFLCAALYLFFGLVFIAAAASFLYYAVSKRILFFIVGTEYVLTVLAVQRHFDEAFPYIFLNNYTIISDAVNNNCLLAQLVIMLIACVLIAAATKKRWGCSDL